MWNLRLLLLGPPQITCNGTPVVFPYDKVQALLVYLAVEARHPHRRSTLAGLLWPDQPEAAARHSLTQALWHLRRILDDDGGTSLLRTNRDTVEFAPNDAFFLDISAFTACLASGDTPQLEQAVALYRGDFLGSLALAASAEFEEWAHMVREHLHRRVCQALQQLTEPSRCATDPSSACGFARRWVEVEPLNEEAHRRLMHSLAGAGQRTAALLQFEHCRRLLKAELGVEPEPETLALYEALKQFAPARTIPATLPLQQRLALPPNRLIGRDTDIATLGAALTNPTTRLVTIIGPGGVGKTRLAQHVALDTAPGFADGVCWVQLGALQASTQVLAALAQALELSADDTRPFAEQVQHALAGRNSLLVLDNCEHLLPGLAALVTTLLAAAPRLVILATSRGPLHLSNEYRYQLAPLALPHSNQRPEAQLGMPAAALFIERARAIRPTHTFDPAVISAICRALDGLPLALELAATRTRLLAPAELLKRLERRLPLLSGGPHDLPTRQQTLSATIDWSYQLLSPSQQALFRRLATFSGGWTVSTAEAACADLIAANGTGSILDELDALFNTSMIVEVAADTGEPRCTMLATIAEFAHEQLVAQGELAHAQARHARAMALFAAQAREGLAGAQQRTWLQQCDLEQENIRVALAWCEAHAPGIGLTLVADLGRYWHLRGRRRDGRDWLERLLERASTPGSARLTHNERAYGMLVSAMLSTFLNELDLATARVDASEALYATLGNDEQLATALNIRGIIAMQRHDYPAAECCFQRSLVLHRKVKHVAGSAACLSNLGAVIMMQGDAQTAHGYYEQSLALYQQVNDAANTALVLARMATLLLEQQEFLEAQRHYETSHKIATELGNRQGIWQALHGLGTLARVQGQYEAANIHFQQSISVSYEIQYLSGLALDLLELGRIALAAGQAERATVLLAALMTLMQASPISLHSSDQVALDDAMRLVRQALDPGAYMAAWQYGQACTSEQIIAFARNEVRHLISPTHAPIS